MSNLQVRFVSAVIALLVFLGTYLLLKENGVLGLSLIVVMVGAWEFGQICLRPLYKGRKIMALFLTLCLILLPLFTFTAELTLPIFASSLCLFFAGALWLSRERIKIDNLQSLLALAATGFIYCTLFPSFAFRILSEQGFGMFFVLLVTVFSGDISAYFSGKFFGKHRLMPALSPKKTVEGAVGGTLGSIIFTLLSLKLLNFDLPPMQMAATAFLTSAVAQSGDLFESLLKRVAGIKDSGKIMPGHGGVLDRLDGVYFGAPIFYTGLYLIQMN